MARTLDMQFMRYMNLLWKASNVKASHCFAYNNTIIFVVPKDYIKQAIGLNNINLQRLSKLLSKRIRIIAKPISTTNKDIEFFTKNIVFPVEFSKFELNGEEVIITAGRENKARLIGRGRIRQKELQEILDQYFGIKKISII